MAEFPSHQPHLNIALVSGLLSFFVALPNQGWLMSLLIGLSAPLVVFLTLIGLAFLISRFSDK